MRTVSRNCSLDVVDFVCSILEDCDFVIEKFWCLVRILKRDDHLPLCESLIVKGLRSGNYFLVRQWFHDHKAEFDLLFGKRLIIEFSVSWNFEDLVNDAVRTDELWLVGFSNEFSEKRFSFSAIDACEKVYSLSSLDSYKL